jgi:hypothetical protein
MKGHRCYPHAFGKRNRIFFCRIYFWVGNEMIYHASLISLLWLRNTLKWFEEGKKKERIKGCMFLGLI